MESNPTIPDVEVDRVEALAADAVRKRPLPSDGRASLAQAIERLPNAVAQSDAEAQATQ